MKSKSLVATKQVRRRKMDAVVKARVEVAKELQSVYAKFEPWVEKRRVGRLGKGRMFDCCVRAAVSKLFDFNNAIIELATQDKAIPAYFVAGTLRGCCEDLIVLAYLQDVSNSRRDKILGIWLAHELQTNLLTQTRFFRKNRPFQNTLGLSDHAALQKLAAKIQRQWKALACNVRGDKVAPSTWSLAKRSGVVEVYDFFYRFSCDIVHFNPAVLLRFGWADDPRKPRFAASNFNLYYLDFGLVYGAYLWCLFLQLLRPNLRGSAKARAAEKELVKWLKRHERWPEMVTREEMNMPPPKPSFLSFAARIAATLEHKPIIRRRRQ